MPASTASNRVDLEIRALNPKDDHAWQELGTLWSECADPVYERESHLKFLLERVQANRRSLRTHAGLWAGAYLDGRLIGDLGIYAVGSFGRYQRVQVHPEFRRGGVGATLVVGAAKIAAHFLGTKRFVLVAAPEGNGHRLYEGLGFRKLGFQRGLSRAPAGAKASVILRKAVVEDAPEIARLIRDVMPEFGANGPGFAINDPEVDFIPRQYAEPRHIYYVLERAGQILGGGAIGPLSGTVEPDICEIRKMYFRPELRGLGQGERLLKLLLEDARTLGYKTAYLETLKSMTRARKLYQRLGFVPLPSPLGNTGHGGCDQWYARRVDSK